MEEINKQKHTSTSRGEIESSCSTKSEKTDEEIWRKKMNLLALLLSFEKYWSPYSLSDGSLYKEETKEEAGKIVDLFKELYGVESFERSDNGDSLKPSEKMEQKLFVRSLDLWLSTEDLFPNFAQRNLTVNRNRNYFQNVLAEFENDLVDELGLPIKIKCTTSSNEDSFHKNVLKWAAQLPDEVIYKVDEAYIETMSKFDTLVVVGDIRRSQDLMTYGTDANTYRDNIIEFMNITRRILKQNCGLYDRFTGDGFIAYFSEYMCGQEGKDYYEMMLKSCREILEFSKPFFEKWTSLLRRIPETEIGLCIGVDSGQVSFKDLNNQLFAIGDACVWATRMNSAGENGDVILNNIPYQVLSNALNADNCKRINSVTKGGEHFSAYRLTIKIFIMSQEERGYKSIESLELSLDRINAWISNCDQKAGILLATIGVMITVLFATDFVDGVKKDIISPFLDYLESPKAYEFSLLRCLFFCFLVLVVIMCVETSFYSLKTISATTDSNGINDNNPSLVDKSYLFFQTIADMNYAEFKEFGGEEKYQDDLTSQIYINSKICAAKFAQYKIALRWFKRLVVCVSIMFILYLFV